MRTLTINSDLDGVVVRFAKRMKEMSEEYCGRELPDWVDWSPWSAWDMDSSEWHDLFMRSVMDGVFYTAEEFPDAVHSLQTLLDSDHRVRFVTSKILHDELATHQALIDCTNWLAERGLLRNEVELCFTHNKQGYLADVVIDDKPSLEWAQESAFNILFDQPWNSNVDLTPFHSKPIIVRAYGWGDVLDYINKLAEV